MLYYLIFYYLRIQKELLSFKLNSNLLNLLKALLIMLILLFCLFLLFLMKSQYFLSNWLWLIRSISRLAQFEIEPFQFSKPGETELRSFNFMENLFRFHPSLLVVLPSYHSSNSNERNIINKNTITFWYSECKIKKQDFCGI